MWQWSCFLLVGARGSLLTHSKKSKSKLRKLAACKKQQIPPLHFLSYRAHHPVHCSFRPTSWAPLDDKSAGSASSPRTSPPCIRCVVRIVEPATSAACSEKAYGVQLAKKVKIEQFSCTTWEVARYEPVPVRAGQVAWKAWSYRTSRK